MLIRLHQLGYTVFIEPGGKRDTCTRIDGNASRLFADTPVQSKEIPALDARVRAVIENIDRDRRMASEEEREALWQFLMDEILGYRYEPPTYSW